MSSLPAHSTRSRPKYHPAPRQADTTGEWDLLLAILVQATRDLAPTMPAHIREGAARFFRNEEGDLAYLCGLANLDYRPLQERLCATFPEIRHPVQLALALEVPA